ncbi:MAG: hypothetical protein EAZ85_07415 [Bacteroidetes bacterium]|nr:MAG: hypothetical protein EAZ85_07415 [Bacteroidota bacterium]
MKPKLFLFFIYIFLFSIRLFSQQNLYSREEMEKVLSVIEKQHKEITEANKNYEEVLKNSETIKAKVQNLESKLYQAEKIIIQEKKRLQDLKLADRLRFDSLSTEYVKLLKEHKSLEQQYNEYKNQNLLKDKLYKNKLDSATKVVVNVKDFMENQLTLIQIIAILKDEQKVIIFEQNGRDNKTTPKIQKVKRRKIKKILFILNGYTRLEQNLEVGTLKCGYSLFFNNKSENNEILKSNFISNYDSKTLKINNEIDFKSTTIKRIKKGKYKIESGFCGSFYNKNENKDEIISAEFEVF